MATVYLIELRLEQKEMLLFLDQNPNFKHSIMAVTDDAETGKKWPAPAEAAPKQNRASKTARKQRAKRGSKVTETILKSLGEVGSNGAPASELKSDLGRAGLSENSLSTGLAILQKDGKIKRDEHGFYKLAEAA